MLTPEALRAARGLLNIGVRDLGAMSGVAFTTINAFENGRSMRSGTAEKLMSALMREGIEIVTTDTKTGAFLLLGRKS